MNVQNITFHNLPELLLALYIKSIIMKKFLPLRERRITYEKK
jgi:hypothetical protein